MRTSLEGYVNDNVAPSGDAMRLVSAYAVYRD